MAQYQVRLGSFKSLAYSFCFFPFAKEITLFVFCLLFLYSFQASVDFFFKFPYFSFFSLTALATSSFHFHHHVFLCLHGPFDNRHVTCAVSIIKYFICCQCSFTSKCFRYLIFDHALVFFTCLFLLELPYTHSWFKLLMQSFCCIKPHVHY